MMIVMVEIGVMLVQAKQPVVMVVAACRANKLQLGRSTLSSPASPSASVALNFYELSLQCNWQEMLCNSTQNQKPVQQISLKSHPCSSGNGEGFKLLKRMRTCFKVLMQDKHI